jgi:two-component system sensor histidine kinase VicK
VICELIENAARSSRPSAEIDVEVRVEGQTAQVRVRDRGVGIPRAARARIFEPFFHAHTGSPNDVGGLGIGLFLAREIVRRHGGAITFESTEEVGTTFIVTLPLDTEAP